MKRLYAITANAVRFMAAIDVLGKRGAPEACWLLLTSPAGLGKSKMLRWWATQNGAVYMRAKTTWTPRVALSELVECLGYAPAFKYNDVYAQARGILAKDQRPVVIDEVEHCLRDITILEAFRDLSDLCEMPVIIAGMDLVRDKLLRHQQISTRITQVVEFLPCSADDVHRMASTVIPGVGLADDLVAKILVETEGRYRLIMDALAEIERHAHRNGLDAVAAGDFGGRLVHDWRVGARRSGAATVTGEGA